MPTNVVMPQMGESIAEGTVVRWIKRVGDQVERDEPLFEISTDKVDAEIPSPAAGVLVEIRATDGETVPVDYVVGVIGEEAAVAVAPPLPVAVPPPRPVAAAPPAAAQKAVTGPAAAPRPASSALPAAVTSTPTPAAEKTVEPPALPVHVAARDLSLDTATQRVFVKGKEILPPLSREQYALLEYLFQNAGKLCLRDGIIRNAWPDAYVAGVSDEALDALVHRVRERLRVAGASQVLIVTIRGRGFRLDL